MHGIIQWHREGGGGLCPWRLAWPFAVAKVCAINSVTINSTGTVWGRRLAGWLVACRSASDLASTILIDLSGKQRVRPYCYVSEKVI